MSSMLGLPWNKERDTLSVEVPSEQATLTKRGILAKLERIYDPLGLISPETLRGKLVYRTVCDSKRAWDAELTRDLDLDQVGKRFAKKLSGTKIACHSPRGDRGDRTTFLWRCEHKWRSSLCLCRCSSSIRDKSGPDFCKVKTLQTRTDHPAARACSRSYGGEPDNQRERGS